ncbi:hypothetical protein V5799_020685, partial [Amblyomma americanum]
MGNASRRSGELRDEQTGLTEREMKLIKDTWHSLCEQNRVLLFLSLFVKHPEYPPMSENFRCKHVAQLKDDPAFRAHGCAIGYHLSSMVDSLGHLRGAGAPQRDRTPAPQGPFHFGVLGQCLVDGLQAKDERRRRGVGKVRL